VEGEELMNSFTFFGESMDGSGSRIGYGEIRTFTGGALSGNSWGANEAQTLEAITQNDVMRTIKGTGKMVLLVPDTMPRGNFFNFKTQTSISRFTLQIIDNGMIIKRIHFANIYVEKIVPHSIIDTNVRGLMQPLRMLSALDMLAMLQIWTKVVPHEITVV